MRWRLLTARTRGSWVLAEARIGFAYLRQSLLRSHAGHCGRLPQLGLILPFTALRGSHRYPKSDVADGRMAAGSLLVGVPNPPLEWEGFFANELETWPLTAHFERPSRIAGHEEQEELGQLDRVTLVNVLSSVRDFIPKGGTRRDLEVAELHDGILYGGGLDVAFWCTAPSLAGIDLSLARQQLHPLLRMLRLLPSPARSQTLHPLLRMLRLLPSRTCRVARNRIFNIFSNSRTTIYAKILDSRHPAPISRLLNEQPEGGVTVDAGCCDSVWFLTEGPW